MPVAMSKLDARALRPLSWASSLGHNRRSPLGFAKPNVFEKGPAVSVMLFAPAGVPFMSASMARRTTEQQIRSNVSVDAERQPG